MKSQLQATTRQRPRALQRARSVRRALGEYEVVRRRLESHGHHVRSLEGRVAKRGVRALVLLRQRSVSGAPAEAAKPGEAVRVRTSSIRFFMKSTAWTCAAPTSASARVKRPMPAPSSSTRSPASDGGSNPAQPDRSDQRVAAQSRGPQTRKGEPRTHDLRSLGGVQLARLGVQHHGLQRRLRRVLRPVRFLGAGRRRRVKPPLAGRRIRWLRSASRRTMRPRLRARARASLLLPRPQARAQPQRGCSAANRIAGRGAPPAQKQAALGASAASRTMTVRSSPGGC